VLVIRVVGLPPLAVAVRLDVQLPRGRHLLVLGLLLQRLLDLLLLELNLKIRISFGCHLRTDGKKKVWPIPLGISQVKTQTIHIYVNYVYTSALL
jgi:hypothetical protein